MISILRRGYDPLMPWINAPTRAWINYICNPSRAKMKHFGRNVLTDDILNVIPKPLVFLFFQTLYGPFIRHKGGKSDQLQDKERGKKKKTRRGKEEWIVKFTSLKENLQLISPAWIWLQSFPSICYSYIYSLNTNVCLRKKCDVLTLTFTDSLRIADVTPST